VSLREGVVKLMQVIPAIDLRGGRCVRLQQGDYGRETIFGDDPAAMAAHWQSEGAERLHIVDLDGARSGRAENVDAVRAILARSKIPCQLGGGIRDDETVERWLESGVDRVIVGTQALKDPAWFRWLVARHPARIALGLDARDGKVAAAGWLETSETDALAFAQGFDDLPLAAVVYTDIARDGMLEGPNLETTGLLAERLKTPVIASGGIGRLDDIRRVAALPVAGCIVGRALYDGRFRVREAQESAAAGVRTP
jgi:phosphoribosylformimino-5-aminoimidazole carboxamide ribotide isomerase